MEVTVTMDADELIALLVNRVAYWTDDEAVQDLYRKMYEYYVYSNGLNLSKGINYVVDNDYINYCNTADENDGDDFKMLLELWNNNESNTSTIDFEQIQASFIEAYDEYNKIFLVRI